MFAPYRPPRVMEVDPELLSPLMRLLQVYDRAIAGCDRCDARAAGAAVRLLREVLDLSSSESRSFDRLYASCEGAIHGGDFAGAARCLRTLRTAWCRVVSPMSSMPLIPVAPTLPLS